MKAVHLPEEKLNELAREVSESLLTRHTFNDGVIRGEELSAFTEHEQINKFLLFQVYQIWNMQISKLKHPFFDFEHAEIEDALKDLRNLLSRHILIAKDDFQPLLQRAVYNNLKLLLDPHDAFSSFFFVNGNQTSVDLFGRYVPFFSDLDFVVNSILKYCQKNEFTSVTKDTFFEKMDRVFALYSQKSGQHIDEYRDTILQKLSGKSLADISGIALAEEARLEAESKAEAARLEAEAQAIKDAEAAEQAKTAAENRRLEEEVARIKAEEETRRLAEEARLKAEQEQREKEEAQRKASLFDTLAVAKAADIFDIDLEDEDELILEETESPKLETPAEIVESVVEEIAPVVETEVEASEIVEELEEAASELTTFDLDDEDELEVVETVAEAVVETEKVAVEETLEEVVVEEILEEVVAAVETETKVEEEVAEADEFLEMAASMEPIEDEEEKTKTILDSFIEKQSENGKHIAPSILESVTEETEEVVDDSESTVSFLDRFLNQKEETEEVESVAAVEEVAEVVEEEIIEVVVEETVAEPEPEPAPEPTPAPEPDPIVEETPSVISAAESASWEITEEEKPASILDKLQSSSQTIADQFAPAPTNGGISTSVNGNRKILLEEIPIHKQYQYVQKVFDGNNVRFRVIVEKVNNAQNKTEVESLVKKYILSNDNLNPDDLVVSEFISLLRNRF